MRIKSVVIFVLGGAIVAAALFAEVIGLDNDPGWGKGVLLFSFSEFLSSHSGFSILFTPTQYYLYSIKFNRVSHRT